MKHILLAALLAVSMTPVSYADESQGVKEKQKAQAKEQAKKPAKEQAKAPEQEPPMKGEQVPTQVQVPAPVLNWSCRLEGTMHGLSIAIGWGGRYLHGRGTVTCERGKEIVMRPVRLHLVAGGIGIDFTYVRAVRVNTLAMLSDRGPIDFRGWYNVGASAGYTFINANAEANSYASLTRGDGLNFEVGLSGEDAIGLGVRLEGTAIHIDAD